MPMYEVTCSRCGKNHDLYARMRDRDAMKSPCCGAEVETRASQFSSVAIQRAWQGAERESLAMAFQADGIEEIRKDCPSMDFKVKDGMAIPVFHNDAHHRKTMREFTKAGERYKAHSEDARSSKRKKVDKKGLVNKWAKALTR